MNEEVQFRRPELMPLSILRAVWKRKLAIGAMFVLLVTGSIVGILLLPSVYSARAIILIEQQRIPERFVTPTVNEDLNSRLNRINQQMLAYDDLSRIVEEFNLYAEDRGTMPEEEIIEKMRASIHVDLVAGLTASRGNTTAFQIAFEDRSPEHVAQVANRLAGNFIDENLRTRTVAALGTSEFITSQIREAQDRLTQAEERLRDYRSRFMGELPEQEASVNAEISRRQVEYQAAESEVARAHQGKMFLQNNLDDAQAALAIARRAVDEERAAIAGSGATTAPSQLRAQLSAAAAQYEVVKSRYSESHPDVVRAKAYVEELQASLAAAADAGADGGSSEPADGEESSVRGAQVMLQAESRVKQLQTQLAVADESIAAAEAKRTRASELLAAAASRMGRIPIHQQELTGAERDYETALRQWEGLSSKSFDANLATTMEQRERSERFSILESARVPAEPVWPPRELFAGGAAFLSIALACLFGFGLELKKNVVLGEWEMPSDVSVLGRIPVITLEGEAGGHAHRSGLGLQKRAVIASSVLLSLVAMVVATSLYFGWISF